MGRSRWFYSDSVIGLGCALSHEEHVGYLLVDKVVVALEVLLIDVQARGGTEKDSIWCVPCTCLYGFML